MTKRGVPIGYTHYWKYPGLWKETKRTKHWDIDFKATKQKKARRYGKFKKGFKIKWKIIGTQTARKIAPGKYKTRLKAKKYRIKSGYGKL